MNEYSRIFKSFSWSIILLVLFLFSGCNYSASDPEDLSKSDLDVGELRYVDVNDLIDNSEHVIAIMLDGTIVTIDPFSQSAAKVFLPSADELPGNVDYNTFQVSPSGDYLAWYAPSKGLMYVDIGKDEQARVIFEPSEWFLTNPYFDFHPDEDVLFLVDSQGTEFVEIDIESGEVIRREVPFPFGTVFLLSPDAQRVLFISGYGQDTEWPSYMFTDISMENPNRFETQGALSDRHMVAWLSDNSGIVVPEDSGLIRKYKWNDPGSPIEFYQLADGSRLTRLERLNDKLFLRSSDGVWHVLDGVDGSLKARVPVEIASELARPLFMPAPDYHFVIEEQLLEGENVFFKRLWLSDFKGIKTLLVPRFGDTTTTHDLELE